MIEKYNSDLSKGLPIQIQRSETITGSINHELIDKILNIRSFTNYVAPVMKVRVRK